MIGDRIEERRKARGLTQAELARRASVPQQTMNGLIKKTYQWSPHLPRIARALGTTIEYLIGEVDDPDLNAPPEPELSFDEQALVGGFRELDASHQGIMLQLARSLPKSERPTASSKSPAVELPPERALARMFEGLLRAMDRQLPLDEQAGLLARRLPIGLSQLVDLLPAGTVPPSAKPRRSRPTPVPEPH